MEKWQKNIDDIRIKTNGKMWFLVICEIVLLGALFHEQITSEDTIAAYKEYPNSPSIVLCRFLCAIFLHISLADELS